MKLEKSSEYDKILNDLRKNGFSKIENFFQLKNAKDIIQIVDIYLKENDHKIWKENNSDCDLRLFGAEKIDKSIYEYFKNNEILLEIYTSKVH